MGVHLLRKQQSAAGSSGGGGMPPKGCVAVRVVGAPPGEEEERFVVPVGYLKHPLFVALLKAAEEEYGFEQQGAITIPCGVDNFRRVQRIISSHLGGGSGSGGLGSGGGGGGHGGSSGNLPFHIAACFRA